jgi:hypothetical protein
MLTFSKSSWHYRLNAYCYDDLTRTNWNLCKYFWFTWANVLFVSWITWLDNHRPIWDIKWPEIHSPNLGVICIIIFFTSLTALGIIFIIIGHLWAGILIITLGNTPWLSFIWAHMEEYYEKRYPNKPKVKKEKKPKQPSMTLEYLKARKLKICPLVKFD